MASISFSQQLPNFRKPQYFTKSKSYGILSLQNNFLAPKFNRHSLSKFNPQNQLKFWKSVQVAALSDSQNDSNRKASSTPFYDLIHKFYAYLNVKDVKRLEKLFDQDCVIEDKAYYHPIQGKVI